MRKRFHNQARGLHNNGEIPMDENTNLKNRDVENQGETIPLFTRSRKMESQRKLFRVIKWKDLDKMDEYKKKENRKEKLEDFNEHDFIVLTDNEEFMKENVEILEGIHHLTDKCSAYSDTKKDLSQTSVDMKIFDNAMKKFEEYCCNAF
jgi:hypothetical protein